MGKVTVKHYLNTNLKPYIIDGEKYYKLYFLLRYKSKNTKIKSLTGIENTENEYLKFLTEKNSIQSKQITNEINLVQHIIELINKSGLVFDFNVFKDYWYLATLPVVERLKKFLEWEKEYRFRNELDFYNNANHDILWDIIKELMLFIDKSNLLISDDIFLIHLYDKPLKTKLKNTLKNKSSISIWERKKTNKEFKLGDIIESEYELKKYDTIEYITNLLLEHKHGWIDSDKCNFSNFGKSMYHEDSIIHCLSKV